MDYALLRTIIETHPTHAATSDADMKVWLEEPEIVTRTRPTITSNEVTLVCGENQAEYKSLDSGDQNLLQLMLTENKDINAQNGEPVREVLELIFVGKTGILQGIGALLSEDVSRLVDAGLPDTVSTENIRFARTYGDT